MDKNKAKNALEILQECNDLTFPPDEPVNEAILIAKEALQEVYARAVEEWYLEHKGVLCPFCESDELDADAWETSEGIATQEVKCINCGESWEDVYTLSGILHDEE